MILDSRLLLVKRKYGSRKGFWCIPCGKVEPDEALEDAVLREVKEETHLETELLEQIHRVSTTHRSGVPYEGTWFLLKHLGGDVKADDDAEEAEFFSLYDLPPMAFEDDVHVINNILLPL